MVTTLAQLHSIDWEGVGLGRFGGRGGRGDYCQRQVSVWSNNYVMAASSAGNKEDAGMKELMGWLPSNLPRGKQPLSKSRAGVHDENRLENRSAQSTHLITDLPTLALIVTKNRYSNFSSMVLRPAWGNIEILFNCVGVEYSNIHSTNGHSLVRKACI